MRGYLEFIWEAWGRLPIGGRIVTALLTVASTLMPFIGIAVPSAIPHHWYVLVIGFLILTFLGVMSGAYQIVQDTKSTFETQIEDLKATKAQELQKALQEEDDQRSIPDVIREMKEVHGEWQRRTNTVLASGQVVAQNENWFVNQLKPRRDERLVRKAFQQWKNDGYRWLQMTVSE